MKHNITKKQLKAFLIEHMHYDAEQLAGMSFEDLADGLDLEKVAAYIS